MPFKWNANRVQVIPGPINSSGPSSSRTSGPREPSRNVSFNAVPPPNFVSGKLPQVCLFLFIWFIEDIWIYMTSFL